MSFRDGFGRVHDDLRVSVTDRCNLRCAYCMPEEPTWFPRSEILAYEELHVIVRVAVACGVHKVRITGGEPLVRRDVARFVAMVAKTPGIDDVSLTTNGVLLRSAARDLAAAGLHRLNVSLDTLDPARFRRMTGRAGPGRILDGLEAARSAGFTAIKINTVLFRGENENEVIDLVALARERGWEVRFIEFMPLGNGGAWNASLVVPGASVRERIAAVWPLEPDPRGDPHAPATRYLFKDGRGAVGFINSVTEPFCGSCSRLRVSADGRLRVCLYDPREVDLKEPLRAGASGETLAGLMAGALARKGRGGALDILESRVAPRLTRTMHQIGG